MVLSKSRRTQPGFKRAVSLTPAATVQVMISLPWTFALLSFSSANGGTMSLKAKSLREEEKPAKADGQSDFSSQLKKNLVVKRAEETSRAWNAIWNNSWVRNAVNHTAYAWKLAENNTVLKPMVQELENTYSQLTNTSGNAAVPVVTHMETHGWNVGALLCAAILLLCPTCCCGLCALGNWMCFHKARKREYARLEEISEDSSDSDRPNLNCYHPWVLSFWNLDNRKLVEVLHQEIPLMLICPFLALLAAPWTTCEQGAPSWIYLIYFPLLARSR
eukprot:Skav217090  [mRNA]  locus=scaffold2169:286597:287421:- [translate_table: standard]